MGKQATFMYDGFWCNRHTPGVIFTTFAILLVFYALGTIEYICWNGDVASGPSSLAFGIIYGYLSIMVLMCHFKVAFTNPGTVPTNAKPLDSDQDGPYCAHCNTYKPPHSHHCRICQRCIIRMDHHCPWMNNCIGYRNRKHFFLFLVYTFLCSFLCLILALIHYFDCQSNGCSYQSSMEVGFVRSLIAVGAAVLLFTGSMIASQAYGVYLGLGTVDRLKPQRKNASHEHRTIESIPFTEIFGDGPKILWLFPVDPIFNGEHKFLKYVIDEEEGYLLKKKAFFA